MRRMPKDYCKGCRECYGAMLKAISQNPVVAAICMGIPTYFLLIVLMFQDTIIIFPTEYYYLRNTASTPFFTLLGFTIFAWVIEIIGVRWMMPNLLSICAFWTSAIGSWWLINFFILIFAGWSYIPAKVLFTVLIGILVPSFLWHFTGDIIRDYKQKLLYEINLRSQALAAQDAAFHSDLETGMPK
jgi:hypothetical protein